MRTDDGCIIHECLSGESEAFGVLVDKYKGGIYAFAYAKLGNFHDAQDVTQEAFLKAYSNLRSLRRWESFAFWLYRIAYNLCREWLKARSRRPDRELIEDQDPRTLEVSSLDSYRESQLNESVHGALDLLPEAYREVLMLYYFGGMNSKEIAGVLGTSPTAVRMRLSRARAQLKEEMITMMGTAFEGQRLQASFTFRIAEAVKRIKIHPMPRMAGLPWGLSLAMGIVITVLSLNPHLSITSDIAIPTGSPLPVETKVLKAGEIPVDILRADEVSVIADNQRNSDGGKPQRDPQNEFMLAPQQDGGGTWTRKADMPTPRGGHCAAAVNGKIYVIGGGPHETDVEEYDPLTDTWTKKADAPDQRGICWASASVVNDRIYVIGGQGIGGCFSRVWEYNPSNDKWTKKSDMPTRRTRITFSTSVLDGKIYVFGGASCDMEPKENLTTVEEYNPETDTWAKKADMPDKRNPVSTAAVNGKIYVFWGRTNRFWGEQGDLITNVGVYDPKTDMWSEKGNAPNRRFETANIVLNDKIYLIGGNDTSEDGVSSTVEEYNPETDTWAKKADMLTERWMHGAAAVNSKIYVIGGSTIVPGNAQNILSSVEEYTPGWLFSVSPQDKLPTKWGEVKSD